jgi:hypothetical protein
MREGKANVTVWFAWLVAAQRRQQRAVELAAGVVEKQRKTNTPR